LELVQHEADYIVITNKVNLGFVKRHMFSRKLVADISWEFVDEELFVFFGFPF